MKIRNVIYVYKFPTEYKMSTIFVKTALKITDPTKKFSSGFGLKNSVPAPKHCFNLAATLLTISSKH